MWGKSLFPITPYFQVSMGRSVLPAEALDQLTFSDCVENPLGPLCRAQFCTRYREHPLLGWQGPAFLLWPSSLAQQSQGGSPHPRGSATLRLVAVAGAWETGDCR